MSTALAVKTDVLRLRTRPEYHYQVHKGHAKKRGIPFLLTFAEWWAIWQASGHWKERGNRKGQYCMARFFDKGAYKVGNVRIILHRVNVSLGASGKMPWNKGKKLSAATCAKMSIAKRKSMSSPEAREKRRKIALTQKRNSNGTFR